MTLHSLVNIILLVYLISFPIIRQLNIKKFKGKNKQLNKALKVGRKIHPFTGGLLLVSSGLHGYLKMGGQLIWHSGLLLWISLLITGMLGLLYRVKRQRIYSKIHQAMGIVVVGLFLLHYFNPWIF